MHQRTKDDATGDFSRLLNDPADSAGKIEQKSFVTWRRYNRPRVNPTLDLREGGLFSRRLRE